MGSRSCEPTWRRKNVHEPGAPGLCTAPSCNFRKQEFLRHYHKRSNIESTFSMMKRKSRDSIRSKTDVAMVNDVLCKILCHDLVVLIHEMYELGIDPVFWN